MADYYPKNGEQRDRDGKDQENERPDPEREHRRQPPNRVPDRERREKARGEWPGEPYGRGYAEQYRKVDRYGTIDERERYGRQGDWRGWSEPGYPGDREDSDVGYGYGQHPAEEEQWSYHEPWNVAGPMSGLGPRGYQRPDNMIFEDVIERLTRHGYVDASDIRVSVEDGEVTLEGTVDSRPAKRMAEDAVESIPGVYDVHNHLYIRHLRPASPEMGPSQGQADHHRTGPAEEEPEG